ncbi:MFS transporter, DHA1 family, bicyclomycin/chloramphenicol resistance protein [Pseudomonas saponiphila]|uniref:Bcr/CflA family efflux transporter n=1 Tax=Pseudomonas saponiphila TaxID=556534 RepID=A0A1H4PLX5_9PSED|nr:multidrug effflux MFS transporter [Pseudomonas saponiphila]SEC08365.1 MFS transporter, DHA1 family, bicyclomycin/chloramphenicol resistance protein [Pseudomonas saponiphila]
MPPVTDAPPHSLAVARPLAPWLWTLLLLVVVCLPRISIDLYLPALPAMADQLRASDAQLQLTLSLYMLGYALSMLLGGPLCDRYGRRPVLLAGTALFLLASLACMLATRVEVLLAARLLQALGGCCGTLIGRVMVRDRYAPEEQPRLLGLLSMGIALSPMLAPPLGSLIDHLLGWRGLFLCLSLVAAAAWLLMYKRLAETRPAQLAPMPGKHLPGLYLRLLSERYFMRYSLAIGCLYCTYFPFILQSPALLQRQLGLSPTAYALVFAATVAGYLLGSRLFQRLGARHGADRLITRACLLNLAGAGLLLLTRSLWPDSLWAIVVPMLALMFSVGLAIPACQLAILQPYAAVAGTASGLFFFIQMALTAGCGLLASLLADHPAGSLQALTGLSSLALSLVWWCLRPRRQQGLGKADSMPLH